MASSVSMVEASIKLLLEKVFEFNRDVGVFRKIHWNGRRPQVNWETPEGLRIQWGTARNSDQAFRHFGGSLKEVISQVFGQLEWSSHLHCSHIQYDWCALDKLQVQFCWYIVWLYDARLCVETSSNPNSNIVPLWVVPGLFSSLSLNFICALLSVQ